MEPIELDRHFTRFDSNEDPYQFLGLDAWSTTKRDMTWRDLLDCKRVVLLAEADSGKSTEFWLRHAQLLADGKPAFLLRVDTLITDGFEPSLGRTERRRLEQWRDSTEAAWIFLDSVDEARINRRSFEQGLRRLARDLDETLARAHIYISCRASDWKGNVDRTAVESLLPCIDPAEAVEVPHPDEDPLLDPLFAERRYSSQAPRKERTDIANGKLLVVRLNDLTDIQTRRLAEAHAVSDPDGFLDALKRKSLRSLAERPGDVLTLVEYWRARRTFDSLEKMMAHMVRRKRTERDRHRQDNDVLSDAAAEEAAERLAAAMVLGRSFTLRSDDGPDGDFTADDIDPAEVLPHLSTAQRNVLLRSGLFAPASYGRIRFHHRMTQEFLTARWLHRLLQKSPAAAVHELLFSASFGADVVVPSLSAVSAWLSIWHHEICDEVAQRDPSVLIMEGDPSSLPIAMRARLLHRFAAQQEEERALVTWVDERMLHLFADARLVPAIKECWERYRGRSFRLHILRLIEAGALAECRDIARSAVSDLAFDSTLRTCALRALAACGDAEGLAGAAGSLRGATGKLEVHAVARWIEVLFPKFLSIEKALAVIHILPRDDECMDSKTLIRILRERASGLSMSEKEALLFGIVDVYISDDQFETYDNMEGARAVLESLAPLLLEVLEARGDSDPGPQLLDALGAFEKARGMDRSLMAFVSSHPVINRALMWRAVQMRRAENPENRCFRPWQAWSSSPLWNLGPLDRDWLRKDFQVLTELDDRSVALSGLVAIARDVHTIEAERAELRALTQDSPLLQADFDALFIPHVKDPRLEELENRTRENRAKHDEELLRKKQLWREFAARIRANPDELHDESRLRAGDFCDLWTLRKWLRRRAAQNEASAVDVRLIVDAFGPQVADAYATAIKRLWRITVPAPGERTDLSVNLLAIDGLLLEAMSDQNLARKLTANEASLALRHVCLSEDSIPGWIDDLAAAHPDIVFPELNLLLRREWLDGQPGGALILSLEHRDLDVVKRLMPIVGELFAEHAPTQERLAVIVRVVMRLSAHSLPISMWEVAIARISELQTLGQIDFYCSYLQLLFILHPVNTLQAIEMQLARIAIEGAEELLMSVLSSLAEVLPCIKRLDSAQEVDVLERVLRWAHRQIPRFVREGVGIYTPDVRDQAEQARGTLVDHLRSIRRPEANSALLRLANETNDIATAAWMRRSAYEHTLQAVEPMAWKPAQVIDFENYHVAPISSAEGLFGLIDRVLQDIARGFVDADASSRPVLKSATDEGSVQEWLAEQLRLRTRNKYHVSRENQVADANRPDIVVSAIEAPFEIAIEIKHGGKGWSLTDLERGLRVQLAQNYLRTSERRFGFFVLTAHGPRQWERPEDGVRIGFEEVLARLSSLAATLTTNASGQIHVKVVGLDARERPRQARGRRTPEESEPPRGPTAARSSIRRTRRGSRRSRGPG